jgi:hypothetical protein
MVNLPGITTSWKTYLKVTSKNLNVFFAQGEKYLNYHFPPFNPICTGKHNSYKGPYFLFNQSQNNQCNCNLSFHFPQQWVGQFLVFFRVPQPFSSLPCTLNSSISLILAKTLSDEVACLERQFHYVSPFSRHSWNRLNKQHCA